MRCIHCKEQTDWFVPVYILSPTTIIHTTCYPDWVISNPDSFKELVRDAD